ncbi:MAG: carboxylesterase family protein [Ferruginibacter sp.]|nr:carboxylesterase family protein [Ferruginibacter sp.]
MRLSLLLIVSTFLFSCSKSKEPETTQPTLALTFSAPPISVSSGVKFASDISYNNNVNSVFDIFLPPSAQPTALVIFIHGGGFVGGDKDSAYGQKVVEIQSYLQNNIAFATINYQFRPIGERRGIYTSLDDIKLCLQFIRYYAASFNIDKTKIACYGGSAGGGASIYLAFHPDMADPNNANPILRESTRIKAAGHITSQCSYDPVIMDSILIPTGVNIFTVPDIVNSMLLDFGLDSLPQLYNDTEMVSIRKDLDMMGWMSADDPPFYTSNANPNIPPTVRSQAIHHPLQAKALDDKANSIGLEHETNIPSLNIFPPTGETVDEFLTRQLLK